MKLEFDETISTSNSGYSGGIIVAWCKNRLNVTLCSKEDQFSHLRIKLLTGRIDGLQESMLTLMWTLEGDCGMS